MADDNPDTGTASDAGSGPLSLADATAMYARNLNDEGELKSGREPRRKEPKEPDQESDELEDEDDAPIEGEEKPLEDDEDDDEDDEAQPDDDEEDDESDDEEPSEPDDYDPDAKVRLKDGKEITVRELEDGYLRRADYSQKTEEVSREKAQVNSDRQTLAEAVQKLQADRAFLATFAKQRMPQPPSQELLNPQSKDYNPGKHYSLMQQYQAQMGEVAQFEAQYGQAEEALTKQQEAALEAMQAEHQAKLMEKRPKFKDKAHLDKFWRDVDRFGPDYGFTAEDVQKLTDHRDIMALEDALKWRNHLRKQKLANLKGTGKPTIKTMKPGKRQGAGDNAKREFRKSMDRLTETGSYRDGVKAYMLAEKAKKAR